jgi:hypothetical protein
MRRILIKTVALAFLILSLISLPPLVQVDGLAQTRRTARRSGVASGTALGAGVGGIRSKRRATIGGRLGTGSRVKARRNRLRKRR